jgi:hypothetical protein
MAAEHYRSAELVFGWSFYRQGTGGDSSSADEFLETALAWFGDAAARIGTQWEKGERLAKLIMHRRTLLVLDGLEPLQNPPGPQEGRLREPGLQSLLRELAAFNRGFCVIRKGAKIDFPGKARGGELRRIRRTQKSAWSLKAQTNHRSSAHGVDSFRTAQPPFSRIIPFSPACHYTTTTSIKLI